MVICWERLSRQLFTVPILNAVLVVLVPLPFGVWGRTQNSILSAPDHCLFVYFSQSNLVDWVVKPQHKQKPSSRPSPAFEKWSGHETRKRSPSAEGTRLREH